MFGATKTAVVSDGVDASFTRVSIAEKAKGFFLALLKVITDSPAWRHAVPDN
jgi:hypothetical protein